METATKHVALKELEGIIARFARDDLRKRIMAASEAMTNEIDDSEEIAMGVKKAMAEFDALIDKSNRIIIMENCGCNYAESRGYNYRGHKAYTGQTRGGVS